MPRFAKISAALLAGFLAGQAQATIYFAHGRMLSLDRAQDRWVLKLEIYGYGSGPTIREQIESGETVRFGWDPVQVPGKPGEFLAVNLRTYGHGRPDALVWLIGPGTIEHCDLKYRGKQS